MADLTPEEGEHMAESVFRRLLDMAARQLPPDPNQRPEDQLHNLILKQIDMAAAEAPKKHTLN